MDKSKISRYDVLKNPKMNFCGFVANIDKYITLKDLRLKPSTFDAAYLEPASEAESALFTDVIASERKNFKSEPVPDAPVKPGDYPNIRIGAVAVCRNTGNFGVITDLDHAHGKAKLVRAHKEAWWVSIASMDLYAPPPLADGLTYGQFVNFRMSPGHEYVGKLLEVKDGKYTALGADGKCYPKGQRYTDGLLFEISEIKKISPEEQEKYLFKLNRRHTPEEYTERLAKTKAKWAEDGLSQLIPKFDVFWEKTLALIGNKPGITWGARVRTIYGYSPTLNIPPAYPDELQANMVCFFTLSNDGGKPELYAFIKDSKWIPESARRHFPASGDKKFYAGGNRTVIPLAELSEAELQDYAVSMAAIYNSACNSKNVAAPEAD
ncbi:MAG TPA: hypothetical protein DEQ38_12560 [Elusimicrobia bacterium]|nr:MAG: hypothetical protein A2089_02420 [Elusimicrobia bacterium GWD2_63_28]HCC48930.1 hypothetical protein [Elusimicrobiota bacterium]